MTDHRERDHDEPYQAAGRTASRLSDLSEIVEVLLAAAIMIRDCHLAGRLCGSIDASRIIQVEGRSEWRVTPAKEETSERVTFPADATWYAVAEHAELQVLPLDIEEAQQCVDQAGVEFPVRLIDSFALGELACRIAGDCRVADYLQSPRVLQRIPSELHPLIDLALGFDADQRCEEIDDLLFLLRNIQKALQTDTQRLADASGRGNEPKTTVADSPELHARLPFDQIGHFQIVRRLGSGGMGDVYEGYDQSLKRTVAVKVLPPELGRHDSFVQRFYSEAASVAKIIHPHIVQIFFIGEDLGQHYFAMEYVEGESLAEQLSCGCLSVAAALNVIEQILQGLEAAHRAGLVHRDVKPGNILRERETDRYLLVDFGLVKSLNDDSGPTLSGTVLGTMDYISPEQGSSRGVDARSDLYSLGVVLYECLSGKLPFTADSPTGMIFQHVYERPVPLSEVAGPVPAAVTAIVSKMMAKDPTHRYADARAVLDDIRAFQQGELLPSHADQIVQNDADYFFRPVARTSPATAATAIISAPDFSDFDDELEVLNRGPTHLGERLMQRFFDWFEAKSPHWAEQLQDTQMQIDRAILKLERHRDHLSSLNRDAQLLLKQLQRDINAKSQISADTESGEDFLLEELRTACAEQEEQAETIQRQLHQVNARLAQVRTERDVLLARLNSADTRRGGSRPLRRRRVAILLTLVAGCLLMIFLVRNADVSIPVSGRSELAGKVSLASQTGSRFQRWPVGSGPEIIIPLQARVRAMDIAVSRYVDQSAYTIVAALENNILLKYYYRKGLQNVTQDRFEGAPAGITVVTLSPQATLTAVAAGDHSIRVFETNKSGKEEYRRLEGHVQPVLNMVFSGDESTLVSLGDDRTVRFWDIRSGTEIRRFEVGRNSAQKLAANGNLSRLLIGNQIPIGDPLVLWNSLESRPEKVFPTEATPATLALSTDARIALAFAAGRIDVWNALTAEKLRTFAPGSQAAAFAPEVNRAATLAKRSLKLWETTTGNRVETQDLQITSSKRAKLLLSENGTLGVVATDNKTLHFCLLPEVPLPDDLVYQFHARTPIHALDLAPDGIWLAGGGDGMIYVWNMNHPPASFELDSPNQISSLAFSPNGEYLAYGTGQEGARTNYVGVRKMDYTNRIQRFLKKTTDLKKLEGFEGPVSSVAWDPNGKQILAGSLSGQIKSWVPELNQVKSSLQLKVPVLQLSQFKERAGWLMLTGDHGLELWNYDQTSPKDVLQTAYEGIACAVSEKERLFAIADRRGLIHLISEENQGQRGVLQADSDLVTDLCFVPASYLLAAAYRSGAVRLWDTRELNVVKEYRYGVSPATSLLASRDTRHLIAAMQDGNVNIWKLP